VVKIVFGFWGWVLVNTIKLGGVALCSLCVFLFSVSSVVKDCWVVGRKPTLDNSIILR